jgi:hypothetical protein
MQLSHISIGGGITGTETIISAINNIISNIGEGKSIEKKFIFGLIDKNPGNIPGGVAYGFEKSIYGYFNNPLRLSPSTFKNWVLLKKNKLKIINYLKKYGGFTGKLWIQKNKKILFSSDNKKLDELYVPRVLMNLWMEEKLCHIIKKIKKFNKNSKTKIEIHFYKGEVNKITKKQKKYKIFFKNNFYQTLTYKILNNELKKITFSVDKKINYPIQSISQSIGLGLPPPKQIAKNNTKNNENYIWDFYDSGSTSFLLKKILKISQYKKKIKIYFIGYKAGLLEALPELSELIIKKKLNIKIICSSKELTSIQIAELSLGKKKYVLKILTKKNLLNINTAKKLYLSIHKELKLTKSYGFKKYDAWTVILKKKIIFNCLKNFNYKQKILYDAFYHSKIRNETRFTYPETIMARELLVKNGVLEAKKEIVKSVFSSKKLLIVKTINNNKKNCKYICDIVINVSGPLTANEIKNEVPIIRYIKKNGARINPNSNSFEVDQHFELIGLKNFYLPGTIAQGFNPERKTIISAILKNSNIVGNNISSNLLKNH